jgi:TfoX/Sxy family transcriptional regulator of competence genes
MAYDEDIAERIRKLTSAEPGVSERKMFGGLAFLIGGNLAVAASGQGGILVRVDPERSDSLAAATDAETAVMRGREMRGWLTVDSAHLHGEQQLEKWVDLGTTYARSLPAKH